jgi:hypothetical protein
MDIAFLNTVINFVSATVFVVATIAIVRRLVQRVQLFYQAQEEVPILLKRDLGLFGGVLGFIGLALAARVIGIDGLRDNTLWLTITSLLIDVPLVYWVWVEYRQ